MSSINKSSPSMLGGAMIIAGTAVGAGMLGLPITTSGMWYGWAIVGIFASWLCMYASGLFILEANLHYPAGAHIDTIAKDCLPPWIRACNSLSLVFVLYILTYAYITVGSPFLVEIAGKADITLNSKLAAFLFVIILGGFVSISTKAVDRVTSALLGGMVFTFVAALPNLLHGVQVSSLLNSAQTSTDYFPYIFVGIASLVASFGYHGNVSSLVKYYNKDAKKVRDSLFYGTLITAIIYLLWITVAHGTITREIFKTKVIPANDNVLTMLNLLGSQNLLTIFSNFAIISSFLGVTLGLFDWLADYFKLTDDFSGRLKTSALTYILPTILALIFPYGFVYAIGYAGLAATIWALIVPALMMKATRKKYAQATTYRVASADLLFIVVIVFGCFVAISEIGSILGIFTKYH